MLCGVGSDAGLDVALVMIAGATTAVTVSVSLLADILVIEIVIGTISKTRCSFYLFFWLFPKRGAASTVFFFPPKRGLFFPRFLLGLLGPIQA